MSETPPDYGRADNESHAPTVETVDRMWRWTCPCGKTGMLTNDEGGAQRGAKGHAEKTGRSRSETA